MESNLKVLIVDDNRDGQLLLFHYLRSLRIIPDIVGDGIGAIIACQQRKYDLVLMDLGLPMMDGWKTIKELRKRGYERSIVVVSAFREFDERFSADISDVEEYLQKPVSLDVIRGAVSRVVRTHPRNRPTAEIAARSF